MTEKYSREEQDLCPEEQKDRFLLRASLACRGVMSRPEIRRLLAASPGEEPQDRSSLEAAESWLSALKEEGIRFLTPELSSWPRRFAGLSDPPEWLFLKGGLPPEEIPSVSVIGSRDASSYGLRMAEYFSQELGRRNVPVISGLAAGVDCAAQAAAVTAGGKAYAVLGCGVNICYPAENYELFRGLSENGEGGVISEYPPDSPPLKRHFPERNRLIAALGDILLVMESRGPKSGSQITVTQALDQGKTVFALPGRITDPLSKGCNDLIRDGAFILTTPTDLLRYLGIGTDGTENRPEKLRRRLGRNARVILSQLKEKPCFPDEIIRKTGLSSGKVMSILLDLEMSGLVTQTAANCYTVL